jgi:hypothetical protein
VIEQLFGSKTRVKLLQLFYSNPNRAFYVREITRKIDEQINSVRRELANLLSIGIVSSEEGDGNRLYYEVNQKYEHYTALAAIFGNQKITSADVPGAAPTTEPNDIKAIKALGNVDLAVLTGQFTRDDLASIDFLLVGDVNQTKLGKYIDELEAKEGKEIRFTHMPVQEFEYRQQVNDRFLTTILESKKQILIDKHKVLSEDKKQA